MVTIKNWIGNEKTLALKDLEAGDTFIFLSSFPVESVFLVMDNDDFVDMATGEVYDYYDSQDHAVKKVDLEIIIKN